MVLLKLLYSSIVPISYSSSSVNLFNVYNQEIDRNHDLCNILFTYTCRIYAKISTWHDGHYMVYVFRNYIL